MSKWCNATFLQISCDAETNSSTSWMAWGWVHFQHFVVIGWTIPLNDTIIPTGLLSLPLAAAFDFRRANSVSCLGSCGLKRSLQGDGEFCTLGRDTRPDLLCPQKPGWRSDQSRGRSRGGRRRDASAGRRKRCSTGSEEHQSSETDYRSENCSPCWPDSSPALWMTCKTMGKKIWDFSRDSNSFLNCFSVLLVSW